MNFFKTLKKEPISQAEIDAQKKRMIDLRLKQIEEGKIMSHAEARKRIKPKLNKQLK